MTTHNYGDHYSISAVNTHLYNNANTRLVAPPQVAANFSGSQIVNSNLARGQSDTLTVNGIEVEVLHLRHFDTFGNDFSQVRSFGYLIKIDDMNIPHLGDVEAGVVGLYSVVMQAVVTVIGFQNINRDYLSNKEAVMSNKYNQFIWLGFCIVFYVSIAHSSETKRSEAQEQHDVGNETIKARYGVEYLSPAERSRNIKTINVNAYFLFTEIDRLNMSLYAGVTATYATGDITQCEGELEEGTLREVNFKNTAFGIGPSLLVDVRLLRMEKFSFHLNGSGSLVLYSKDFPAGGDFYNFMWRAGPVIECAVKGNKKIGLSYQWAHISNGQGLGPQNPSYNAQGLGIFFSSSF